MQRKVVYFESFAYVCPYFTNDTDVNNGYGCTHPQQEETDIDTKLNQEHGKCYCWSCPLGIEPDEEDFENPEVDWGNTSRDDCTVDGEFQIDGEYMMVNIGPDASEDEKQALMNYERYINRYNPEWLKNHNQGLIMKDTVLWKKPPRNLFIPVIIILVLTAALYCTILASNRDRRLWNGGKCPDCDIRWQIREFGADGSRAYHCRKCDRRIRIVEHVEHEKEESG